MAARGGPPPGTAETSRTAVDDSVKEQVTKVCRDILAPIVRSDGGEMYLVRFDGDDVHIHLAGSCAGCPGASLTGDKVILPALRTAAPKVRVVVTTGVKIPPGAEKV
jgi:Fe-S cluster biogenesis protein NfuA